MKRRLLPLALSAAATVTVAFACMAMVPTNPVLTRPPVLSTTTQPDTTTITTTTMITTTTTPAALCNKCSDVVYKVPEAATTCGGAGFYCTDDALLSRTLTDSCRTATCTSGRLFAYDSSGTPQPVTGDLACASKTPAVFEDDSAPPVSFPNGASVFCQAETSCQKCPAVEYTKNTAEPEANFAEKPFLGKHGCPIKDCRGFQLRYEDKSEILHSVTCNPTIPGFINRNGQPVTKPVGCYDCGCSIDQVPTSVLCPPGYFCQNLFAAATKCKAICSPGDLFITYKTGMPDMPDGVRVQPEDVFCDLANNWQPFGKPDALMWSTCATPIAQMATTRPVLAECPALEDLGGGTFSNVLYKSIIDPFGAQILFATCRNGMIATASSDQSTMAIAPFVFCDSRTGGWFSYPSQDPVAAKVTCKPNSCNDFLLASGYTKALIDTIDLVEETGRCRATCKNGQLFTIPSSTARPMSLVNYQVLFEYYNDDGLAAAQSFMC